MTEEQQTKVLECAELLAQAAYMMNGATAPAALAVACGHLTAKLNLDPELVIGLLRSSHEDTKEHPE